MLNFWLQDSWTCLNDIMSRIPESIVETLLDNANIVEVIGEDITLRKAGVNYKGICPFHDDSTPSMVVSPVKRIFKCFACGEGGNVIHYLGLKNSWSFPEACRYLGKKYNIDVPEEELSPEEISRQNDKDSCKVVIEAAAKTFVANLADSASALSYLQERQITKETMEAYSIGYAEDKNSLLTSLSSQSFQTQFMEMTDLIRRNERGSFYDTFRNRIILPFFSRRGEVIGFTGRDLSGNAPAKYLNTGDTILYNKGKNIYGLYQAQGEIRKQDKVYIVEGQFDVLSLFQTGIKNVVAGSGTAFTADQRKLLRVITQNVTFIYDGDAAGIHAAEKNLPDMISAGFHVSCIALPDGKDPDDLAKELKEETREWINKNEVSYVQFLGNQLLPKKTDAHKKAEAVKTIAEVIAREHDAIVREALTVELAKLGKVKKEQVEQIIADVQIPVGQKSTEPGLYGLDLIEEFIDKDDPVLEMTTNFEQWQKHAGREQPWLYYVGVPAENELQDIAVKYQHFVFHSPNGEISLGKESDDIVFMKELFRRNAVVEVVEDTSTRSFVYWYIGIYGEVLGKEAENVEWKNKGVERCAEVISLTTSQERAINLPAWAELMGFKPSQLKEILQPFLADKKAKAKVRNEGDEIWNSLLANNLDALPQYVEEDEEYSSRLRRFQHFPLLNKKNVPVAYAFRDDKGNLHRVGDFYLEPLFHIYSDKSEENLRVCRLNSMVEKPTYIAWPSKVFANLRTVIEQLINEGGYNFENGTSQDWARIWTYMSHRFPKCNEIKVYGQQKEGFWLFANSIFHEVDGEWKLEYADELGLMSDGDLNLYSPSFSRVNKKVRDGEDENEQDKWFVYTDTPMNKRITFEHWASLMNQVYNVNDNGKWAIVYAIMCAFRSVIHPIRRLFTSVFFLGPTMSGKTQIAISIRSLFIKPDAPSFNLNFGSDAAFFSILERFRDVPQVMEEYNDEKISDNKFQGLKSVTYDGDGKTKRKDATSNNISVSKVYAPVVLLGQESPQKDDNALANRVVLCNVPKRERFDEHAQLIFQELKAAEKDGLSYLLLEILKLRPLFKKYFAELLKNAEKDIQRTVEATSDPNGDQARVITTVSMFVATVRLLTDYAPEMKLPFTYQEFFNLAVEKVKWQVNMLVGSDKIAAFFATISEMIDEGKMMEGRDYQIRRGVKLTINGIRWTPPHQDTAVLIFNLQKVCHEYQRKLGALGHPLSQQTLTANLTSNKSWIGNVSAWRFRWKEAEDKAISEVVEGAAGTKPNQTVTRQMVEKMKNTSAVVLNYDILRALYGIDFERRIEDEHPSSQQSENESLKEQTTKQEELPF